MNGTPRAARQVTLLLSLWWTHMRRRARRVGDAPKRSGAPTFLLISSLSSAYMVVLGWRTVARSVADDPALFAWHGLGALCLALGSGISKGSGALKVRGARDDDFLEPLPLTTAARVALQLADSTFLLPLMLAIPLAAGVELHVGLARALPAALLGVVGFCASFVVGQALVAWARALGPAPTARHGSYLGVVLTIVGLVAVFSPLGSILHHGPSWARALTRAWLYEPRGLASSYAIALSAGALAYFMLREAEHVGFDRAPPQRRAPRASKHRRDRIALEWQMTLRQGGRAMLFLVISTALIVAVPLAMSHGRGIPPKLLSFVAGFVVYLGSLQAIAQAGRAAQGDALARPFLAALPLSPHQVLQGKARALRMLLSPTLVVLVAIGGLAAWQGYLDETFRMLLAAAALYVMADGAISVAFLSSGIGVTAIGGGQPGSSFSAQLLMIPVLATIIVSTSWAAAAALVAVCAVTWEARRAAKRSVRWLDDPSDDAERETSVWRALLAATAFFALQGITYQLLDFGDVAPGYRLAGAYSAGAVLLALLTWRNGARFRAPRWLPRKPAAWPLAAVGGGASALFALQLVKILPPPPGADPGASMGTGESLAALATMTVAAPLIEEYFFRGWLQQAIEEDLPEPKKRWAFVLSALAFALAHLGSYGLPQLVFGLIAGALFMFGGGLLPGILAHAIHNGVLALLGTT